MAHPDWLVPSKRNGQPMRKFGQKFPIPFLEALRRYADEQSVREGRKISQATILRTYAQKDPRLSELVQQEEQRLPPKD